MKILNSLTGKISLGYIAIAVISIAASIISLIILNKNKKIDSEISEFSIPALILNKDLKSLNNETKRLCNSWIYTPSQAEKQSLQKLLKEDFPALSARISEIITTSNDEQNKANFNKTLEILNKMSASSASITTSLATDDDYADDAKVDAALTVYDKTILPLHEENSKIIQSSITKYSDIMKEMQAKKDTSYQLFNWVLILMLIVILATGVISLFVSRRTIIEPINELKEIINKLGTGEITEIAEDRSNDEIGEMRKSIKSMIAGFKSKTDFAIAIGDGNYVLDYEALGDKDNLGNALIEMRSNLKKATEEDKKRSWATEGLAKFVDILRSNNAQTANLSENILTNLVKYLKANQGTMFVVNDENEKDVYLELVACYAYDRKKHVEKRIEIGEGLVGQAYLEKDIIFLTDVPENYVTITSGLGDATPRCVMIIPLKMNEKVYGILEIASFTAFEKYMIEFTEKLGESIASTIAATKINDRTSALLAQTQIQAEEMRAQEEEMRQNMEELQATQEEMGRKENDYIKQIESLKAELQNLKS